MIKRCEDILAKSIMLLINEQQVSKVGRFFVGFGRGGFRGGDTLIFSWTKE